MAFVFPILGLCGFVQSVENTAGAKPCKVYLIDFVKPASHHPIVASLSQAFR